MYRPEWMNEWIVVVRNVGLDQFGNPVSYDYVTVKGRVVYGDKSFYTDGGSFAGVFFTSSRAEAYLDSYTLTAWMIQNGYTLTELDSFALVDSDLGSGNVTSLGDLPISQNQWNTVNVRQQKKALFGRNNRAYIYLAQSGTN